jgi:hypothetical protein
MWSGTAAMMADDGYGQYWTELHLSDTQRGRLLVLDVDVLFVGRAPRIADPGTFHDRHCFGGRHSGGVPATVCHSSGTTAAQGLGLVPAPWQRTAANREGAGGKSSAVWSFTW